MADNDLGRIRYIEPTNLFADKNGNISTQGDGTLSDAINYPYEDYSMAIDLTVEMSSRYSCGLSHTTEEKTVLDYTSTNGTISFLGGTDIGGTQKYMTTNYTDISMVNPEKNTTECLGIESISITYNSWQYPQVVIKFIDVRGATVMQPAENAYYNGDGDIGNSRIYKSLFTFPYPIFTLKVKGFYGKGVTYKLAVQKTSIEFDATTENFFITATFVGYMFGIYADLPMTYIGIAPYTDTGKAYWDTQIENGTFVFKDYNGEYQHDMLTIPKLKEKIATAAANQESISVAAEGEAVAKNYDSQMETLRGLMEKYPFSPANGYYEGKESLYKIIFPDETKEKSTRENVITEYKSIYEYINAVSGYDGTHHTNYSNYLKGIIKSEYLKNENGATTAGKEAMVIDFVYDAANKRHDAKNSFLYNRLIASDTTFLGVLNGKTQYEERNFSVLIIPKYTENLYETIIKNGLKIDLDNIIKAKAKSEREYEEKQASIAEKIIGFRPSIKNMYDLVFAHVDTFMHCFYDKMGQIRGQLEHNSTERKKTNYFIENGDTDTPNDNTEGTMFHLLPPFAAFYGKNSLGNIENIWPEEKVGTGHLIETEYVKEILRGGQLYNDVAIEIGKKLNESDNTEENAGGNNDSNGGSPTTDVGAFIPVTTYDFVNKDRIINPYNGVKRQVSKGDKSIEGEILGMFALRAFNYLCTNDKSSEDEARAIGTMEALNFYKAIGDEVSDNFINFVKKYAQNKDREARISEFNNLLTTTTRNDVSSSWLFNDNQNTPLFIENGGNLSFTLYTGEQSGEKFKPLPMYPNGFSEIKTDYTSDQGLLLSSRDYLTTINFHLLSGSTTDSRKGYPMKGGTFVVYEDRDFISQVYNKIESEMKSARDKLKETKAEYGDRGNDEYGKVKNMGKIMKNFTNNMNNSFNEDPYKDNDVFVDKEGSKVKNITKILKEGGYNERKEIFVKLPIGEKNSHKGDSFDKSIFNQKEYTDANIETKAYMFLMNLPLNGSGIENVSENGVSLKARLLKEGAWYWAIDNSGKGKDLVKDFRAPINTTYSRVNYLKAFFEEWATSLDDGYGFAANEKRLTNKNLYEKSEKGVITTRLNTSLAQEETNAADVEQARKLQEFLRNLMLVVNTTMDYYDGVYSVDNSFEHIITYDDDPANPHMVIKKGVERFYCPKSSLSNAFDGFMDELNAIYGKMLKEEAKNSEEFKTNANAAAAKNPFNSKDLKLSTYMTLKTLYDKWLCGPYKDPNKLWSLNSQESDFQNFIYMDSFYNEIGYKITANISKISEWLSGCIPSSSLNTGEGELLYTGRTVYEFLAEVAQSCGGTLIAMPQKFGLNTADNIKDMFRPIPTSDIKKWDTDDSSFVFMYTYKLSEHLGDGESNASDIDMNGYSPKGDGFSLTKEDIMGTSLDIQKSDAYEIPAFGVTYGKQNQCFFKSVSLNTESAGVTEASLAATFNIASKGSDSPRETMLFGQDIYRVYSNYAYQCSVEMMGNMQVMPLMYFQLNNIPLWKGAYMIKKVSHNITAGNISTNFEGVRLNKYAIPIGECAVVVDKNTGSRSGSGTDSGTGGGGTSSRGTTETLNTGNANGEALTNYPGDKNKQTDTIDFDEGNVTPQKPIICIVAGHGPNTQKAQEWNCMYKMVSEYLVPKLRKLKYKDGTPYNVQLCNKNGKNTGSGYSTIEIQRIVKKYGSDKVISVACHWNGGAGRYHGVFLNRLDRGVREDSKVFAEYMRSAFEETKNKILSLEKERSMTGDYPSGMTDGQCSIYNLSANNSDGGPNQNCACVLTENWFADYGCLGTSLHWNTDNGRGEPGTGRYWLTSTEPTGGYEMVSEAHVKGIQRYIDSLS